MIRPIFTSPSAGPVTSSVTVLRVKVVSVPSNVADVAICLGAFLLMLATRKQYQ